LLRVLFWRVLGPEIPFLFLWPAVMVTAWYGGLGPGVLATFTALVTAEVFLLDEPRSLRGGHADSIAAALLFLLLGCMVSALTARLRRARQEAAQQAFDAAEQREWLRVTLASVADAVVATDLHGRVAFINTAAQSLTGWKEQEACGRAVADVLLLKDERTGLGLPDPAVDVLTRGVTVHLSERTVLCTRQGTAVPVAACAAPIRDTAGNVRGMVVALQDASRERDTVNELRRRADDLVQTGHRKNDFIALLAHELRNPLSPIKGAARLLRQGHAEAADVQWAAGVIERQVDLIGRLVEDLLDVSRVNRGKISLQREQTDLAEIVNSAVEISRPLIDRHAHDLVVQAPSEPVVLFADRARLAQVVSNLLNNAAKYTADGGRIWLDARVEGAKAVIRVKDTGAGISAEMLPHIFEMFAQDDRSLPRSEGGLGIGLCLVRGLVELHGGRVEAFSDGPGCGSEFVVSLPLPSAEDDPKRVSGLSGHFSHGRAECVAAGRAAAPDKGS
jgi:PAS domain S-box-containing protein